MRKKLFGLFNSPKPAPVYLYPFLPPDPFDKYRTKLYLRLYHGRKSPDEDLNDWGTDGPYIGPIQVNWTYGSIKIHDEEHEDFEFLPEVEGMVLLEGVYYGDLDLFLATEEDLNNIVRQGNRHLTAGQFLTIIRNEFPKPFEVPTTSAPPND